MNVFENVLLCTDFSSDADHALEYTLKLAGQVGSHIHILHVTEPDMPESTEEVTRLKDELEHKYFDSSEIKHSYLMQEGIIEECVNKAVWSNNIDLVILGMKGLTGEREILKGSITANLVDKPAAAILGYPGRTNVECVNHICIAVDKIKKVDRKAFEMIRELAKLCGSTVEVFHVQNSEEPPAEPGVEGRLKDFFGELYNGYREIPGEDVLQITDDYVHDHDIDLLVLFHSNAADQSHHRSMAKRWIFKSEIPLLILPGH